MQTFAISFIVVFMGSVAQAQQFGLDLPKLDSFDYEAVRAGPFILKFN